MDDTARAALDAAMQRLAAGDRSVFSMVFTQLWTPMLRFCKQQLKHEADAHDAAQNALQKVLERASDYDPKRPALPWALAIAAWECRTIQRKYSRRKEVSDGPLSQLAQDADQDQVEQAELIECALATVQTLSSLDRAVLTETYWDQDQHQRRSPSAAATQRKRKERALERLRTAFRRLYGID
jgi:RNA polymerase sigma-70 factor (ECF subfamily)